MDRSPAQRGFLGGQLVVLLEVASLGLGLVQDGGLQLQRRGKEMSHKLQNEKRMLGDWRIRLVVAWYLAC